MDEARTRTLDALRRQVGRIERGSPRAGEARAHLAFGIDAIDAMLPGGGLPRGALHEVLGQGADSEHAAVPSRFVASLLTADLLTADLPARTGQSRGQVLWAMRGRDLFAPALHSVGLHPDRLILVDGGGFVLDVMEEALRHRGADSGGLAAVVGEIDGRLGLTASRRLQLAAESSGTIGFAIRRSRRFDDPALLAPSAAASRWRVGVIPGPSTSTHAPEPMLGPAAWRLELLRCRGAGAQIPLPAHWNLEACHETGRLSLAAALADRPAATRRTA